MSDQPMEGQKDFRETLYTVTKDGRRKWVYAAFIDGFYRQKRRLVAWALLAFYLIMPWVIIEGEQGILLDIYRRKFVFFGQVFWATDSIFLFFALGILGFCFFLFTAVFGRIWCGWACPETVFLEFLFRPIERLIEGNHRQRAKLDAGPWSFDKIRKKALKHAFSATLAWIIASTFLAYFVGRERLLDMMTHMPSENPTTFGITLALMGAMGFQFGWFREQFCTVVCPYGRFQSVLLDGDSIVVGYDETRGEPRGKIRKNDPSKKGDCVNCNKCVFVCPTGIDIRNGLQMECINCTACMDACDEVMTKIKRPTGLIRYASDHSLHGKKTKFVRPRIVAYFAFVLAFSVALAVGLSNRKFTEFQVLRGGLDKPFEMVSDDVVRNHLHVRLSNKTASARSFTLDLVDKNDGIKLIVPISPFPVGPEGMQTMPLFVEVNKDLLKGGKIRVAVIVNDEKGVVGTQEITLLGPGQ